MPAEERLVSGGRRRERGEHGWWHGSDEVGRSRSVEKWGDSAYIPVIAGVVY